MCSLSVTQNLFSKESALKLAASVGFGMLTSRFSPITIKEGALVGALAGNSTTLTHSFINNDTSNFKKTTLTIAMLAATFYGTVAFFKPLNTHFAIALTPESITKIFAFSLIGQAVTFVLTKFIPSSVVAFSKLEDDKVTQEHQKYKENPETFKALPPVMQQLMMARFSSLELDYIAPPAIPTVKELEALSDKEVAALHQHRVANNLTGNCESKALLLRYIEADLPYDAAFKSLTTRLLPTDAAEVMQFSPKAIAWHKAFFTQNPSQHEDLSEKVQWELYQCDCTSNYCFDSKSLLTAPSEQIIDLYNNLSTSCWIDLSTDNKQALRVRLKSLGLKYANDPQTPKEVQKLDEETVKIYNKDFKIADFDAETVKAFHRRFYDLMLPLPNGIGTIDKLSKQEKWSYPEIELTPPQTLEEVAELHDNQLPWLYSINSELWDPLSFDVQVALNTRFHSTQHYWRLYTASSLTDEAIQTTSEQVIRDLHTQLSEILSWAMLTPQVQAALNRRFPEVKKAPISLDALEVSKLEQAQVKSYHAAFETRPESWAALWKKQQQAFNAQFKKVEGLTEFGVTSWR